MSLSRLENLWIVLIGIRTPFLWLPPHHFLGVHAKLLQSCPLFATPWTVAHQAPLSVGFSRQEYWSGLPCPPSGDLPDSGIKPGSALQVDSLSLNLQGSPSFSVTLT